MAGNHVSDFTRSESQIILDLINHDNEKQFSLDDVRLGNPVPNNDGRVDITLSPVPYRGYKDSVSVSYGRLDIARFADIVYQGDIIIPQGEASTLIDLLPEINSILGTNILRTSVVDVGFGQWDEVGETKVLQFGVNGSCKVFEGSVTVMVRQNLVYLQDVISNEMLSGLNYPVSP